MRKGEGIYRCIDKGCGYEITGTHSKTDGKRCPKCNGPIVPIPSECNGHLVPIRETGRSYRAIMLELHGLKESDFDNLEHSVDLQYEAFIATNVDGDDTDG